MDEDMTHERRIFHKWPTARRGPRDVSKGDYFGNGRLIPFGWVWYNCFHFRFVLFLLTFFVFFFFQIVIYINKCGSKIIILYNICYKVINWNYFCISKSKFLEMHIYRVSFSFPSYLKKSRMCVKCIKNFSKDFVLTLYKILVKTFDRVKFLLKKWLSRYD